MVAAMVVWAVPGLRRAADEAVFLRKLAAVSPQKTELTLRDLMPGDWELVCSSSCYQGKFYLEQYKRSFPSSGPCHDGGWGLTFVSKDGAARAAGGSCNDVGASIKMGAPKCLKQENARLILAGATASCRSYLLD